MKKLLTLLAIVSVSASAQSIYQKPQEEEKQFKEVFCGPSKDILKALKETVGGKVLLVAISDAKTLSTVLVHNKDTGKWAIIDMRGEDACLVGAGNKLQFNPDFFKGQESS